MRRQQDCRVGWGQALASCEDQAQGFRSHRQWGAIEVYGARQGLDLNT